MKKLLCYLLLPALVVLISSCKDDDPPAVPDHAAIISGTYSGWINIYELNSQGEWEFVTQNSPGFEVSRTTKNMVSIIIPQLNFMSPNIDPFEQVQLENINIHNITVAPTGNKYNLAGQNLSVTMGSEQYTEGIASVTGTMDPSFGADNLITIQLKLEYAPSGEVIYSKSIRLILSSSPDYLD